MIMLSVNINTIWLGGLAIERKCFREIKYKRKS